MKNLILWHFFVLNWIDLSLNLYELSIHIKNVITPNVKELIIIVMLISFKLFVIFDYFQKNSNSD